MAERPLVPGTSPLSLGARQYLLAEAWEGRYPKVEAGEREGTDVEFSKASMNQQEVSMAMAGRPPCTQEVPRKMI
jgi:hypothetical protein